MPRIYEGEKEREGEREQELEKKEDCRNFDCKESVIPRNNFRGRN